MAETEPPLPWNTGAKGFLSISSSPITLPAPPQLSHSAPGRIHWAGPGAPLMATGTAQGALSTLRCQTKPAGLGTTGAFDVAFAASPCALPHLDNSIPWRGTHSSLCHSVDRSRLGKSQEAPSPVPESPCTEHPGFQPVTQTCQAHTDYQGGVSTQANPSRWER